MGEHWQLGLRHVSPGLWLWGEVVDDNRYRVLCMKTMRELDSAVDFHLLSLGTIRKKRRWLAFLILMQIWRKITIEVCFLSSIVAGRIGWICERSKSHQYSLLRLTLCIDIHLILIAIPFALFRNVRTSAQSHTATKKPGFFKLSTCHDIRVYWLMAHSKVNNILEKKKTQHNQIDDSSWFTQNSNDCNVTTSLYYNLWDRHVVAWGKNPAVEALGLLYLSQLLTLGGGSATCLVSEVHRRVWANPCTWSWLTPHTQEVFSFHSTDMAASTVECAAQAFLPLKLKLPGS